MKWVRRRTNTVLSVLHFNLVWIPQQGSEVSRAIGIWKAFGGQQSTRLCVWVLKYAKHVPWLLSYFYGPSPGFSDASWIAGFYMFFVSTHILFHMLPVEYSFFTITSFRLSNPGLNLFLFVVVFKICTVGMYLPELFVFLLGLPTESLPLPMKAWVISRLSWPKGSFL